MREYFIRDLIQNFDDRLYFFHRCNILGLKFESEINQYATPQKRKMNKATKEQLLNILAIIKKYARATSPYARQKSSERIKRLEKIFKELE